MGTLPTGIFSLDYINTVWQLLVPPYLRTPKQLAWGAALMAGKQWKNDAFFGSYMLGSADPAYNSATSYSAGNRIIYYINGGGVYWGDNAVYEALAIGGSFSGKAPIGTNVVPSTTPSWVVDSVTALKWLSTGNNGNPFYWVQVQPNFIGVIERTNYSCQQLTMEIALNRWLNVSPYANYQWDHTGAPPFTQIYIETNQVVTGQMYYFPSNNISYSFPQSPFSTSWSFPSPPSGALYDFTIYVPNAIFNNLIQFSGFSAGHTEGPSAATGLTKNGSVIRALVDKFNAVGMIYNITTY